MNDCIEGIKDWPIRSGWPHTNLDTGGQLPAAIERIRSLCPENGGAILAMLLDPALPNDAILDAVLGLEGDWESGQTNLPEQTEAA